MATSFKNFLNNDVTTTRTLLHEAIPITGSIVSGTYNEGNTTNETNIKNFSHGLFESVYDYPFLSSSANHIFDITVGYSNNSELSSSANLQNADKINIYNQMAQLLVGHDADGNIKEFHQDANVDHGGQRMQECFFLNFSRLLQKDEIKKGSFQLDLGIKGVGGAASTNNDATFDGKNFFGMISIKDLSGSSGYKINSPAGEYGILYATASTLKANGGGGGVTNQALNQLEAPCGYIFYQAGIAVISGSVFQDEANNGILNNASGTVGLGYTISTGPVIGANDGFRFISGSSISGSADAIRNRINSISFNNTTELNSTIYFARAGHNEFNYSSNPTYIDGTSQIRVKNSSLDQPVSYITTVGLYSADNELLAVAKVSEPLKKTPDTELTLRVRLDY